MGGAPRPTVTWETNQKKRVEGRKGGRNKGMKGGRESWREGGKEAGRLE